MPMYDVVCDACDHTKEMFLKLNETVPECNECGNPMKIAMSAPAFILKGSGWYSDHYGLKAKKTTNKESKNG